jgi:acyl carrier protein
MNARVAASLQEIFRVVLDLPPDADLGAVRQGHHSWDSLAHVSLVAALESEFGIRVEAGEGEQIRTFGAAAQLLARKLEPDS